MICEDLIYMFLIDEDPYYFEQDWYFGEGNGNETAVKFFASDNGPNGQKGRKLIGDLTFYELCGLKEVVDRMFENLLPRYNGKPDDAHRLLRCYRWLKEKADKNPLFGLEKEDIEKTEEAQSGDAGRI